MCVSYDSILNKTTDFAAVSWNAVGLPVPRPQPRQIIGNNKFVI